MRATPVCAAPLAVGAALLLGGCATLRAPAAANAPNGAAIVAVANTLVGTRYQFGGADAAGFDCSGLALYAYERVGIAIPRTAAAQQRAARAVPAAQLAPGDLVFFRIRARAVDHVGIYSGGGRFIHAPRAGHAVEYADLYRGFYARRFVSAGRFW
jgi:cell wall-associated NlpC family hydrolase